MMTTAVVVREDDQPVVLDTKEEKVIKKRDEVRQGGFHGAAAKSKIQRLNNQYIK